MKNEKELAKEIIKYCKENEILGSINIRCGNKLVSFDTKDKIIYCKECGKKL